MLRYFGHDGLVAAPVYKPKQPNPSEKLGKSHCFYGFIKAKERKYELIKINFQIVYFCGF